MSKIVFMEKNEWDSTDRRIFGKIAACEKRRRMFWPSVRLIAHDLRMPRSTVQDRLKLLESEGAILVYRRGAGYTAWRVSATARNARGYRGYSQIPDTPLETREAKALKNATSVPARSKTSKTSKTSKKSRAGIRCHLNKDPPDVVALAEIFHETGLRSQIPEPIRLLAIRKLARALLERGMTLGDGEYLVHRARSANSPPALLGYWLKETRRWREVVLDRKLGKRHRKREVSFLASGDSVRVDKPAPEAAHVGAVISGLVQACVASLAVLL